MSDSLPPFPDFCCLSVALSNWPHKVLIVDEDLNVLSPGLHSSWTTLGDEHFNETYSPTKNDYV
eukprot:5237987-Amphidinium_carterae.1